MAASCLAFLMPDPNPFGSNCRWLFFTPCLQPEPDLATTSRRAARFTASKRFDLQEGVIPSLHWTAPKPPHLRMLILLGG
jgi:hypothetical protein